LENPSRPLSQENPAPPRLLHQENLAPCNRDFSSISTNPQVKELARELAARAYPVEPESLGGTLIR
jgi:hypothetical protein